jgi:hypothetical protein
VWKWLIFAFHRTFRERRDQYLKQLEQQVQRLQKTQSDLQSQVDRLQHELSASTGRLVVPDSKRNGITQYPGQNGFPAGEQWESTFISPEPNHHESVSGGSAVIWIESQHHKPWQMHVQLASRPPKDHPQWPLSPVSLEGEITSSPQVGYIGQQESLNDNWAGERQYHVLILGRAYTDMDWDRWSCPARGFADQPFHSTVQFIFHGAA